MTGMLFFICWKTFLEGDILDSLQANIEQSILGDTFSFFLSQVRYYICVIVSSLFISKLKIYMRETES